MFYNSEFLRILAQVVLFLVKLVIFLMAIFTPMVVVMLSYCWALATYMPATTATIGSLLAFAAAGSAGAFMMVVIPFAMYLWYGRRLEARLWS